MNPKVQTFIYCFVDGLPEVEFMMKGVPDFPCTLKLGSVVSRLCRNTRSSTRTLAHVTSDELATRLASLGDRAFFLHPVRQQICSEMHSLMFVRAEGLCDRQELGKGVVKPQKTPGPALPLAVLTALGMEFGNPEDIGQATARQQASRLHMPANPFPEPPRPAVEDAMVAGDCFEISGDEVDMIEDIVSDTVEAALHHVEHLEHDPPPADVDDDDALGFMEVATDEVVEQVIAAAVPDGGGAVEGAGSSSSSAAPLVVIEAPPFAQAPLPIDSDLSNWNVSGLGYVRHNRASRDAGRATAFKANTAITCYLHSKCSVVRSAYKYTREYMTQWLVCGVPCGPHATADERKAAGVEHMKLFVNL